MNAIGVLFLAVALGQSATPADREVEEHRQFDQAMHSLSAGAYTEAEAQFNVILKQDPGNPSVLANLGALYSKMHRYTEAITVDKEALTRIPNQPAIELNLGLAYLKQEDYDAALPYFEDLHTRSPENQRVTLLAATALAYGKEPAQAIPLLENLLQGPQPNDGALYVLGIAYTRTGDTARAHRTFTQLFRSAQVAEVNFLIGEAYADATDYEQATQAFQSTLQSDPAFAGAHRELGRTLLGMHNNEQAEAELRKAIAADPNDASALYYLGALLVQLGRLKDGRIYLESARELAPDSWATYFYLGKADLELNDLSAAEHHLQEACTRNPDDYGAPYLLSRVLRREGRPQEASLALNRVAKLHATQLEVERRLKDPDVIQQKASSDVSRK